MDKVNSTQQEQLLNIGAYLREVRLEKGKQIDEVANQIFIRPALVKAIEAGDWESLPEPVFVQGFIRRYAEYLGLDGRELSKRFEPTPVSVLPNPELANSTSVEGIIKPQDKHGLKVLSKAEPAQNGATLNPKKDSRRNWNWLIGVLGVAALVGLVVWLTTRNTPQRVATPSDTTDETAIAPEADPETDSESVTTSISPDTAPEPAETASPSELETATAASAAPITFAVNIEDDAWLRVTADGERVYEGILSAGSQESWTADTVLEVTAGNSGSVLYSFNGSEERAMGNPGAVTRLTLTPDTDPESLSAQ